MGHSDNHSEHEYEHCHHEHDHHNDEHCHHEHHHHDGDECCDHEHDAHCHHDHEHHHEHGHTWEAEGFKLLETHTHEGATVCSFEKETRRSAAEAVELMKQAFNDIEAWFNAQDATIGHIKGFVRENGPVTTFSTVGAGTNIEGHPASGAAVNFASIVFGPGEEEVKDKVTEIFFKL